VLKAAFEAERDTLFSTMRQPARVLHTNEN
jgi:hypothetical protein